MLAFFGNCWLLKQKMLVNFGTAACFSFLKQEMLVKFASVGCLSFLRHKMLVNFETHSEIVKFAENKQ
jgi:hypothetical protein